MSNAINFGALAAAQEPNIWTQGAQVAQGIPLAREAQQDAELQRKLKNEQAQNTIQNDAITTFNNKKQFYGQQLIANPQLASNHQLKDQIIKSYTDAGLPPPVDTNGNINIDEFKKPWDQADDKLKQFIAQLAPDQRKPFLDQYSGVPQDLYTTKAFVNAKDQANLQKATAWITNEDKRTDIMAQNSQIRQERANAQDNLDYHRVAEIDAQTAKYKADAENVMQRTSQLPQELDIKQQRLNGYLQSVQQAGMRGQARYSAVNMLNRQAKDIIGIINHDTSERDNLQKAAESMIQNGAAPDDPAVTQITQQIQALNQSIDGAQKSYDQATSFIFSEGNNLATQGEIGQAGGGNVTNVTTVGGPRPIMSAPAGLSDGFYPNSKYGPVTVRGGQVYKGQI
jgi:uncharacterized protein YoxC